MSICQVAKVIYAPHKAFKEIIQNPRYLGPILILILFAIANSGFMCAVATKTYVEKILPAGTYEKRDEWTENATLWKTNGMSPIENDTDCIKGDYYEIFGIVYYIYGEKSIEFQAVSSSQIWIQLNISSTPINCSGTESYQNLTFRMKIIDVETPSNVSLYLFSTNPEDNFYYNLTSQFDAVNVWKNITVAIGPESQGWKNNTVNADWSNITGLRLDFTWQNESNITLLVDGLFFHGVYKSLIETDGAYLFIFPISAVMQFIIQWFILGCTLYVVPKIFKVKTVWKPWLIVAGFALIAVVIQQIIFTAIHFSWSNLYISLKTLGKVPGETEEAYLQNLMSLVTILWVVDRVVWVWIIALCAVAFKFTFEISWLKSFLVAVPSYLLYVLLLWLLVQGAVIFLFEWELIVILFVVAVCMISGPILSRRTMENKSN
ncbi:MAG: YIP1 family protein [Candidatus Bathyarchaeia archaeon]